MKTSRSLVLGAMETKLLCFNGSRTVELPRLLLEDIDYFISVLALVVHIMTTVTLQKIKHIAIAEKAGVGPLSLDDVEISRDWEKYRRQFQIRKTLIDRASSLLFCSDAVAKLVMDSPLTPAIYKVAALLRSSDEKEVASQIGRKKVGLY